MKRTITFMGMAITLVGLLQPVLNVPKLPDAHAVSQTQTHQIVNQVITSTPIPADAVPATTWRDNPNNCNLDSQYIAADAPYTCIDKPVAPKSAPVASQASPVASYAPVSSNAAKTFIYEHESGNNPGSINPSSGACGLGQALPCSKMGCSLSDYDCQDAWFTNYMLQRYGSWENAMAFWLSHKWW